MFDYLRDGTVFNNLQNLMYNNDVKLMAVGALIVALVVYFTFLSRRNNGRFTAFLGGVYDLLNFNRLILEGIFKILYLLVTIFFISLCLFFMYQDKGNFALYFINLIVGVIAIRIGYEVILMVIMLCKNVSDINRKMKSDQKNSITNPMDSQHVQPQQPFGIQSNNAFQQPQHFNSQQPGVAYIQPQQMSSYQPTNINMANQQPIQNTNFQPSNPMIEPSPVPTQETKVSVNPVVHQTEPLPVLQNVKYCNACGNVLESGDIFCANCGNKVD